jgi:predicted kinase
MASKHVWQNPFVTSDSSRHRLDQTALAHRDGGFESHDTRLVLIRGNSGSGKTSIAREVRRRYGRGCALVEQDYFRRIVLQEHDTSHVNGVAPRFIANAARFVLENGYHVVLEGIFFTDRYRDMLLDLISSHSGRSRAFYLDVSFEETVRRHANRPLSAEVTAEQMREWYKRGDILGIDGEHIIPESSTFEESVDTVLAVSGLVDAPPLSGCPNQCPHCMHERAEAAAGSG